MVLGNCNSYTPTGGSDTIKKTICDALKNGDSTPEKCTFITGTSTCVNRTCENIVTPTSNTDCIQWIAKC